MKKKVQIIEAPKKVQIISAPRDNLVTLIEQTKKMVRRLPPSFFRELPQNLNASLRDYQKEGYRWLSFWRQENKGSCLADDMGLGKTLQTIALVLKDIEDGLQRPVLILAPTSVIENWYQEFLRFAPQVSLYIHHGNQRTKGVVFLSKMSSYDVVLSSYSLACRDQETFTQINWQGLILDEAQQIKNAYTQKNQAIRSLKAQYRIALTGTPMENNLRELWNIMSFLNPKIFPEYSPIIDAMDSGSTLNNTSLLAEIKDLCQPFLLRRTKKELRSSLDLPEKRERTIYYRLTAEQKYLYEKVVGSMKKQLKGTSYAERKGVIFAAITHLKQICNHPSHFLKESRLETARSQKLSRLIEMWEVITEQKENALVFSQYTQMGELLYQYFRERGVPVWFFHGSLSRIQRQNVLEEFQKADEARILILSLKAGGFGINLTEANHVFHFDRWWNPATENQASDRAFRIGQKKDVEIYRFLAMGTIEEKIEKIMEEKKAVYDQVMAGTNLVKLSDDELWDLFSLRD